MQSGIPFAEAVSLADDAEAVYREDWNRDHPSSRRRQTGYRPRTERYCGYHNTGHPIDGPVCPQSEMLSRWQEEKNFALRTTVRLEERRSRCHQCGQLFHRVAGVRGRPQTTCSPECRKARDADRKRNERAGTLPAYTDYDNGSFRDRVELRSPARDLLDALDNGLHLTSE